MDEMASARGPCGKPPPFGLRQFQKGVVGMTATVIPDGLPHGFGHNGQIFNKVIDLHPGQAFLVRKCGVKFVQGLVMLAMVDFHGASINVRFKESVE